MLRIALDVDGVLADTMRLWIRLWNRRSEQKIGYEDLVEWDFWKKLGISGDEFMKLMSEAWRMWWEIPPTEPNISEKVAKIKSLGKLDIVTARPRETEICTLRWLEAHRIPYDDYVWISSSRLKAKLDYDAFIDDSPLIVDGCLMRGKILLLYDRPWNRSVYESGYVRRVKSLDEAYHFLVELARKL
ncbi:MAG: hypothetical protein DRN61_02125 [Thaumarchaeota archaeon]|nr:MAG: hypothetical protein DRN61_02125 [Nitrososphaerota archaeon]HDD42305.1 hypothetical protein [Nitrososphaeria archaeon]